MRRYITLQLLLILSTSLYVSLAQLNFPASSVQIPISGMTFYYELKDQEKKLYMGLEIDKNVNYFAVGFANEENYGMAGFDMVAFVFNPAPVQIFDLYAFKNGHPPSDVSLGGTSDYKLIDSYIADNKRQVLFERLYDTGDKYDYIIDPEKVKSGLAISWAWSNADSGVSFHASNAGTIKAKLTSATTQEKAEKATEGFSMISVFFALHGYIMLIGWGFVAEISLEIGRYRKFEKKYIQTHVYINVVLYILTIPATAIALYILGRNYGTYPQWHFYLGISILILSTLQLVSGWVLRSRITGVNETKLIPRLKRFHLIAGSVLYIITKVQVGIGFYMYMPGLMEYLTIYYILIFMYRIYKDYATTDNMPLDEKILKKCGQGRESQSKKHQKLMDLLNTNTPVSEIVRIPELKNLKWAILDDKVFETQSFNHPGGNFILNYVQGREVGRFIYGAYPLELYPESTQHRHSNIALIIIKKNYIGTIKNGHKVLVPRVDDTDESSIIKEAGFEEKIMDDNAGDIYKEEQWTLENKTEITPLVSKFEFSCRQFVINPNTEDIAHIGKHMKVSHHSYNKTRLYTLVLSQTEVRLQRRAFLWNKVVNRLETTSNQSSNSQSETLPLLIKNYDIFAGETFSSFLHKSSLQAGGFKIEGPYGTGLDLTSNSTGLHYIFAAGTGIFPFLDLFDYLLENLLVYKQGVNMLSKGFKVHLIASFGKLEDFVGLDICEMLVQACKQKGLEDAFKMTIRAKDAKENNNYTVRENNFDDEFISQVVDVECEKIYVCGPPQFNLKIPKALGSMGIEKAKIILV